MAALERYGFLRFHNRFNRWRRRNCFRGFSFSRHGRIISLGTKMKLVRISYMSIGGKMSAIHKHHVPWFLWPFAMLWHLLATIVGLTGRLIAMILGLVYERWCDRQPDIDWSNCWHTD